MLNQQRLQEFLSYDPETGVFTWIMQCGNVKKGGVAGGKKSDGYIHIRLDGIDYKAHRLAWLYIYSEFPEKYLDHINEVKDDNRIINLRLATEQENQHNQSYPRTDNTSGFRGVSWKKHHQKWHAQIAINGKNKHLGFFNSAEEAHEVYLKTKKKMHLFWKENAERSGW